MASILIETLPSTSRRRRSPIWRDVTNLPSRPANGELFTEKRTRTVGGSIAMRVCIVIKVGADGLINRVDEYFDPAEMAPLLSA